MFSIEQKVKDYMSVVVTHRCNLHHRFCVDSYVGRDEDITAPIVDNAIEFALNNSIKDILLVGGEPTLHPEIIKIAKSFHDAGLRTILTTNYTNPGMIGFLDGIIDCFNISWYGQPVLPHQENFKSDITLHALIFDSQLETQIKLDRFIDSHSGTFGHLKFSTLVACNYYSIEHQAVEYIDGIDCEWVVLFNEMLGQIYRGTIIKRYDRIINHHAEQSYKCHVDGQIIRSWDRGCLS